MSLIGVVGLADSGKGTVGDYLVEEYGFKTESFAKPVKDATAAIFNWPRHLLEGNTKQSRIFRETKDEYWSKKLDRDVTPRWAMQIVGTEACRDGIAPEIWIHSLEKRVEDSVYADFVITDVRFPNEMSYITSKGGILIQSLREPLPEWYNIAYKQNANGDDAVDFMGMHFSNIHISEWAHIGYPVDFVIHNNGTLEELKEQVDNVMNCVYKNV